MVQISLVKGGEIVKGGSQVADPNNPGHMTNQSFVPTNTQPSRTVDPTTAGTNDTVPKRTIETGTPSPYYSTPTAPAQPKSYDQLVSDYTAQADGLIANTKQIYNDKIQAARDAGKKDLERANALAVNSGYTGGTEANRVASESTAATERNINTIRDEQAQAVSQIYNNIYTAARTQSQNEIDNARNDRTEQRSIEDKRKQDIQDNVQLLAKSGAVDYEAFKNNPDNQTVYDAALKVYGSEDVLKGIFALNRPQDAVIDTKWDGSKLYQVYKNPVTGKIRTEMVDLADAGYNPPANYTKSIDLGDRIMLIPDNFDPTKDTPYYISKGLSPADQQNQGKKDQFTFSASDRSALLGGGYSLQDIAGIEKDVQAGYSYNDILKNTSDANQQKALQTVFGNKPPEDTKLTREAVAKLYAIEDSNKQSSFFGFKYGKTGKEQLDTLMNYIDQLHSAGFSDKDIYTKLTSGK